MNLKASSESTFLPLMALFATALLWSLGGVIFKPLTWHVPGNDWLVASHRSLYAAITFLVLCLVKMELPVLRPRIIIPSLAYAGLVLTFVVSTRWTSTAEAVFLQYTAPMFTAILLWIFRGEKQTKSTLAAIAIGACGLALLFYNQTTQHGQGSLVGNAVAVVSGLCFAGYCAVPKAKEDRLPILFYGNLFAAVPALLALSKGIVPPQEVSASLIIYSQLTTVIPFLLFAWAAARCGELPSLLITSLEPVLATLWAILFFGETLTAPIVAGSFLVLTAALLSSSIIDLLRPKSTTVTAAGA